MTPRERLFLFTVAGSALAVAVGIYIANDRYGLAVLTVLASLWLIVASVSAAPPDAWLLAAALVGYVVGNRGFAQVQPAPAVPILPAEAVLLVGVPALIVRLARRTSILPRDALNVAIVAWMVIGAARLPVDLNRYGFLALRDFAMVYYALFFFIGQAFGERPASCRLITRALSLSFLLLVPVVASIAVAPDFLVDHLTWRGIPLIYHKSDLIATSLAAGSFWLWTRWEASRRPAWLLASACSLASIGAMASPRAGMVAVAVTTCLWLLVRRWRIAAFQLGVAVAAAAAALAYAGLSGRDLRTSAPYSVYEHALSLFDPAGTGTYINAESGDPGGNNRFRWIWWRDVAEDTVASNPVFGLGFGSDLSSRFLADYDLLTDESFAARSPHSMVVTVLGRMGIAGLAAWIAVSAAVAGMVWKLLRRRDPDGMGLASIVAVIWLSACFGVVLEGPMGAVVFWTALGMASAALRAPARPPAAHGARKEGPAATGRLQWAQLDTQSGPR